MPAGYSSPEHQSTQVFSREVLEALPCLAQDVLPVAGVEEAFYFDTSKFFVRQVDSPYRSVTRSSHKASTHASRAGSDQIELGMSMLALPQEGA